MKGVELEEAINTAIERTVITQQDKEDVKRYFDGMSVNDLIDSVIDDED